MVFQGQKCEPSGKEFLQRLLEERVIFTMRRHETRSFLLKNQNLLECTV
jgi:hypothetical protein